MEHQSVIGLHATRNHGFTSLSKFDQLGEQQYQPFCVNFSERSEVQFQLSKRDTWITDYRIINIDQANSNPIKPLSLGQIQLAHFSRKPRPIESSRKLLDFAIEEKTLNLHFSCHEK